MLRGVASGAVVTHGHLVQIGVAGNAGCLRFFEYERFMATPAVHHLVLPR